MKKKYFKNNIVLRSLFLTAALAVVSVSSCKKFTELTPINTLSEATAFDSPTNIELVMIGVYNTATVGTYNGGAGRGYPFGAAAIQQSEMRGEDMVNLATFFQFTYESTINATTANNVNLWSNLYALINQCNILIEGVEKAAAKGTITAAISSQYSAEAKFLRALAHHELVVNFSRPFLDNNGGNIGVPYRTVGVTGTDAVQAGLSVPRGTVAEDYAKILEDLNFAEANLSTSVVSRANKGAAIALKTRIYQHMGRWDKVIEEGAKLGTATGVAPYTSPVNGYALTASPDGPFYVGNVNANASNKESIFSIANSTAANGGTNGALPGMFGPTAIAGVNAGRGLVATNPNLYTASFWVTGDLRRNLLQVQQSTTGARYFFNYKYRDYLTRTDFAPIIRYAEVLLNVAEAYSRTSSLDPKALSLLNAVRNRSVPVANQYVIANFLTQKDLTQAILNERRIEFAGEGRRWADITRLANDPVFAVPGGIPAKVAVTDLANDGSNYSIVVRPVTVGSIVAIPYSNFHFIWPIPVDELNANPNLKQNPDY